MDALWLPLVRTGRMVFLLLLRYVLPLHVVRTDD